MKNMRLPGLSLAVLAVLLAAAPAGAAVVAITDATFDAVVANPIISDANLTSITAGEIIYSGLVGATSAAVVDSGTLSGALLFAGTAPTDGLAAVTDGLNATTGSANIGDGVNFFFGQNIDGADLFFVDFGGADATVVRPVDGAGNLIGDFTLSVQSDGGVAGGFATLTAVGIATSNLQGVVFNTSDFSGTGTLAGVEGIRLAGSGLDVQTVGLATVATAIPEPSSLALLLVGGFGMALRRRTGFARIRFRSTNPELLRARLQTASPSFLL